jgi:hypothetical protein
MVPHGPDRCPGTVRAMGDTITQPTVDVEEQLDDGDHDRFAHYVRKSELMMAYVEGQAITALCGKKWVPTRDPERYPVCPTCKEIRAAALGEG